MKVGVMVSNFRLPLDEALAAAVAVGVDGVQVFASGEYDARTADRAKRRELRDKVLDRGLEITALCAWGGGVDLGEAAKHAENIPWGKQLLDMARDLDTPIWQGHVGIMPNDETDPRWSAFVDACGQLAEYGESIGTCLALETGPEPPRVLQRLMEAVDSPGLRINYDPGNFILWPAILRERGVITTPYDRATAWAEFEPEEGVKRLGQYTVHTHAKDALVHADGRREEMPLGRGWLDWPRYLGLLREAGFDGWLTIERETGGDPLGDIRQAVGFLREQLTALG